MLCSACGAENPDKAAFCGQCGAKLPPPSLPGMAPPVGDEPEGPAPSRPDRQTPFAQPVTQPEPPVAVGEPVSPPGSSLPPEGVEAPAGAGPAHAPDPASLRDAADAPNEMAGPSEQPALPPAAASEDGEAPAPSGEPPPQTEEAPQHVPEPALSPGPAPGPREETALTIEPVPPPRPVPGQGGTAAAADEDEAVHPESPQVEALEGADAQEGYRPRADSAAREHTAEHRPAAAPSDGGSAPLTPGPRAPAYSRGEEHLSHYCPACGAELKSTAAFCGRCGAAATPRPLAPAPPAPVPAHCPACGAELKPTAAFCGRCGAAGGLAASPAPPPASALPLPARCPACGGKVSATATFCGLCGAVLGGAGRPAEPVPLTGPPPGPPEAGRRGRPKAPRRRWGCRRVGCLVVGIVAVLLLAVAGWFIGLHTGTWERLGISRPPEARLLGGRPNEAAAQALKAELVAAGFSDAGLRVAVLPVKGKSYNLAVAVMDASQGFRGSGSADLMLECLQRLATGPASDTYGIGRVAGHYKDGEGNKILSLTAATQDIRAFASGQMSKTDLLKAVEGNVDWGTLFGGMP